MNLSRTQGLPSYHSSLCFCPPLSVHIFVATPPQWPHIHFHGCFLGIFSVQISGLSRDPWLEGLLFTWCQSYSCYHGDA